MYDFLQAIRYTSKNILIAFQALDIENLIFYRDYIRNSSDLFPTLFFNLIQKVINSFYIFLSPRLFLHYRELGP